jgi:GT2 family glycosyltransferase
VVAQRFSIVVVTWECAALLKRLVASMNAHLSGSEELVIVDNASTDAPERAAREWKGDIVFVRLDENRGFGAANNVGVERASHAVVVLLNPDTELVDDSLRTLVALALELRALVGPRLLNPDGSIQPSASGPEVGVWPWARAFLPGAVTPRALLRYTEPYRLEERVRVAWLIGACVAAPREMLRTLGPFDETIHLYSEDLDLGLRAAEAGIASWFCPSECRIIHHGGGSAAQAGAAEADARREAATTRRAVLRRLYGARRERAGSRALAVNLRLREAAKRALGRRPAA